MKSQYHWGPAILRKVFCAVFRHSLIVTNCIGYKSCARCEAQVGDSLAGVWVNTKAVIFGHNCTVCNDNYSKMRWRDRMFVRNPMTGEVLFPEDAKERDDAQINKVMKGSTNTSRRWMRTSKRSRRRRPLGTLKRW